MAEDITAAKKNLREWVETTLDTFLAPSGLEASKEAVDTLTQVIECRAKELGVEAQAQALADAQDQMEHARNVIDDMKSIAAAALAKVEGRKP